MKLLIQPADDQHTLNKSEMEEILAEMRAQHLPAELSERKPDFGELASFVHLWQLLLEVGGPGIGVAAFSHMLGKVLPPALKLLAIRQQQTVTIKVGSVSVKAPAHMSERKLAEVVDRLSAAVAKPHPTKTAGFPVKKTAVKKPPTKFIAAKKPV